MKSFEKFLEFDWDKGNINKNLAHKITDEEAEDVFLDRRKQTFKDKLHSGAEERFILPGKTTVGRLLFIAFTIRGKKVRIISARDINKREVSLYEEKISVA